MDSSLLSFRIDWRWSPLLVAASAAFVACAFPDRMPLEWGYENSLIENIQLGVMLFGVALCATAKNRRSFYRFAAFVVLLCLLREVSFGRTVFFPVEGQTDTFRKWKEIPCGWLAHWGIAAYIAGLTVFFVSRRLWKSLWEIVRAKSFPVWGFLLMLAGALLNTVEEAVFHDYVAEEIGELGMYLAFVYLLAVYTRRPEYTNPNPEK
ncbi:MAG: hypothetical protein MJ051_04840 [Akkermansia sp.]|nr:hypothetical protein [Akkermansia sp.]